MVANPNLIHYLDQMEHLDLDPDRDVADIGDFIKEYDLGCTEWIELINRYGTWKSVAVMNAVGMCMASEISSGNLRIGLDHLIDYARSVPLADPASLGLSLEILKRGIWQSRQPLQFDRTQKEAIGRLLLAGTKRRGSRAWVTTMFTLELFAALEEAGKVHPLEILLPNEVPGVRLWLESFLREEKDGPFFERAEQLLRQLDANQPDRR